MSPVEISLGRTFASLLFGTLLRSTLLALFCGVLVFLLRARPAAIRHSLWRGMLFALLLLPILQIVAPPLRPASPHLLSIAPPRVATTGLARWKPTIAVRPLEETGKQQHAWILILIAVYLGVTFLLCVRLMAGLHRLKVIARRSQFIGNAGFHELAHDTWLESGAFIIPRMRVSREVIVPIVIESAQEIFLLLPASWTEWDEGKLRLVLTHEMCHVRRGDPATALLASVATCLFWVHPLSWFLKRQLAYLAEEACDDAVLEAAPDPERYVRILLDFAREVVNRRARVLEPASAMVQGSQLRTRIQKIYAASELRRKRPRLIRAIAVALFVPALYVAAAARFDPPQQPATFSWPMTSEKAARLEAGLQANPEDLKTREGLLQWYFNTAQRGALNRQLLWLIQHHPELSLTTMTAMLAPRGGRWNTPNDYQRLTSAWEQALANHSDSADVLFNAGAFFAQTDPERALALLQRVRSLDTSRDLDTLPKIASIYASAIETHSKLRNVIENSTDSALLSEVGTALTGRGMEEKGLELLQRDIDLDPGNPRWRDALESAKAEPIRQRNYRHALDRFRARQ